MQREQVQTGQDYTRSHGKLCARYLGLTQTCRQIQFEFRMWWLSSMTVLLSDVQPFFRAFIERFKTPLKEASKAFQAAGGNLNILGSWCGDVDLLHLLKLKAIEPKTPISITWEEGPLQRCSKGFDMILANQNSVWLRWIKNGTLKGARVMFVTGTSRSGGPHKIIRLVLGKQHVDNWMGPHAVITPNRYRSSCAEYWVASPRGAYNVRNSRLSLCQPHYRL